MSQEKKNTFEGERGYQPKTTIGNDNSAGYQPTTNTGGGSNISKPPKKP